MWIKICGITRLEDAITIRDAGADAIGLNFYAGSKRCLALEVAGRIVKELAHSPIERVGVFVNATAREVADVVALVGLTCVQFHGDEPPELLAEFHELCPRTTIIRAVRVDAEAVDEQFASIDKLARMVPLHGCLLDAFVPGSYGGTGHVIDTVVVRRYLTVAGRPRLIVAGGLTPDNVAAVIRDIGPFGVDTASGVESAVGIKDADKVREFIGAARRSADSHKRPHDML